MINRKKIGISFAAAFSAASLLLVGSHLRNSQLFMPSEYKLIKKTVSKLAKRNDLGVREIGFLVTAGSVASYYAKDLGLCKRNSDETCPYYRFLNPFKKHDNPQENEIIKLFTSKIGPRKLLPESKKHICACVHIFSSFLLIFYAFFYAS